MLSAPQPPYDRFPYGFASPANAYARGLRRMLTPSPLTSEFVGMASCAPATFHKLPDDKGESDGSSIGDVSPCHSLSRKCAMVDALGQPPVVVESTQTHTPPDPRVGVLASGKRTPRNYDNGGRTSHRLHRRIRHSTLRPVRMTHPVVPGVTPARFNMTS